MQCNVIYSWVRGIKQISNTEHYNINIEYPLINKTHTSNQFIVIATKSSLGLL